MKKYVIKFEELDAHAHEVEHFLNCIDYDKYIDNDSIGYYEYAGIVRYDDKQDYISVEGWEDFEIQITDIGDKEPSLVVDYLNEMCLSITVRKNHIIKQFNPHFFLTSVDEDSIFVSMNNLI